MTTHFSQKTYEESLAELRNRIEVSGPIFGVVPAPKYTPHRLVETFLGEQPGRNGKHNPLEASTCTPTSADSQRLVPNRLYMAGLWSWATIRSCIGISIIEVEIISISTIDDFLSIPKEPLAGFFCGLPKIARPPELQKPRLQISSRPTLFLQKDRDGCKQKFERMNLKDILWILDFHSARNTPYSSESPIYGGRFENLWGHISTLDYFYGSEFSRDLVIDSLLGYSSSFSFAHDFYSYACDLLKERVNQITTQEAVSRIGNMSHEVCRILIDLGVLNDQHMAGLRISQRDAMLATDLGL